MALPPPPLLSAPPQSMIVNLEFSLPVDLAQIRDGDQLHAPIAFAAPLALAFILIARAFAATAPPPDERRRYRRGADPDRDPAGHSADLAEILNQLNIRSAACQSLVVCETHRLIANLPTPLLHHYRSVSGRLRGVHQFRAAATLGLRGGHCQDGGGHCRKTPLQLLLNSGLLRRRRTAL